MRTQVIVGEEFYIEEVSFFFLLRNLRQWCALFKQHLLPSYHIS